LFHRKILTRKKWLKTLCIKDFQTYRRKARSCQEFPFQSFYRVCSSFKTRKEISPSQQESIERERETRLILSWEVFPTINVFNQSYLQLIVHKAIDTVNNHLQIALKRVQMSSRGHHHLTLTDYFVDTTTPMEINLNLKNLTKLFNLMKDTSIVTVGRLNAKEFITFIRVMSSKKVMRNIWETLYKFSESNEFCAGSAS
jgi:hypothetical protein